MLSLVDYRHLHLCQLLPCPSLPDGCCYSRLPVRAVKDGHRLDKEREATGIQRRIEHCVLVDYGVNWKKA